MKPWLKTTLIIFFSILLLMFAATVAVSQLYGNRLKVILLHQLNKELLTKADIQGKVEIALWKNFPQTSLLAENVILHGSDPLAEKKVVVAEKVYFLMSFYDLIRQQWNIQSVTIENSDISLYKNRQGKINFRFFDDKPRQQEESNVHFDIQHALLKNVNFSYLDESADTRVDFRLNKATLKGNFKKDNLDLSTTLDGHVQQIALREETYLTDKKIHAGGWLKIETEKNQYHFKTKQVIIEKNEFSAEGLIAFSDKETLIDLKLTTENGRLSDVLQLIPPRYTEPVKDLDLKGNIKADIRLSGSWSEKSNPFIHAHIDLKNGSFLIKAIRSRAENIAATLSFNNGTAKSNSTSALFVEHISGRIAEKDIAGKLIIKNFDNPDVHLEYTGNLDLAVLQPFLLNENLTAVEGMLDVKQLLLKGKLNRFNPLQNPDEWTIQARCAAHHIQAVINAETFILQQGDITATNRSLILTNGLIKALQSDIRLNLQCDNWKQYLYALTQPAFNASNQLIINADIEASRFNWNLWQEYFTRKNIPHRPASAPNSYNRNQAANLGGTARVKIHEATFNNFKANQLSAQLTFTPNQIFLHNGSFHAASGEADTKGYFAFKDNQLEINFSLVTRNADIKQIFSGFSNFNQNNITSDNIEGKLTADIKLSSLWNHGIFDPNALYVYGDIKIENGKLLNYKPLESLSRFIEMEELRHVRFGTLKNVIEIKNQTITIPKMLVSSNALSLSASGSQTFSGNINYFVQLNLFDVLGKKFGKRKQHYEFEEVDENEFNLFLHISGTTDKPIVKYDRSGMREKLKKQKEEFIQHKEGPKSYDKIKESKQWETKEELEYIEWD